MGRKYGYAPPSACSGTPPAHPLEGCWVDVDRTLEPSADLADAEARWQLWWECYEMTVLLDKCWLLVSSSAEEGI